MILKNKKASIGRLAQLAIVIVGFVFLLTILPAVKATVLDLITATLG